jgi:phosphoribosylformylglycinamidine synthase PurS subunit
MNSKIRVIVTIKSDVLDPAGEALKKALVRNDIAEIQDVRIGKTVDIQLNNGIDSNQVKKKIEKICEEYLANPVMENFEIQYLADGE